MIKQLFKLLLLGIIFYGCKASDNAQENSACIDEMIVAFERDQACSDGASVKKYIFQGKIVYVFNPGICGADMAAPVIDATCEDLGFLGGIIGNTVIQGQDFSIAVFQNTVWEN